MALRGGICAKTRKNGAEHTDRTLSVWQRSSTHFGAGTFGKSLWNCLLYSSPLVGGLAWMAVALIDGVKYGSDERARARFDRAFGGPGARAPAMLARRIRQTQNLGYFYQRMNAGMTYLPS